MLVVVENDNEERLMSWPRWILEQPKLIGIKEIWLVQCQMVFWSNLNTKQTVTLDAAGVWGFNNKANQSLDDKCTINSTSQCCLVYLYQSSIWWYACCVSRCVNLLKAQFLSSKEHMIQLTIAIPFRYWRHIFNSLRYSHGTLAHIL